MSQTRPIISLDDAYLQGVTSVGVATGATRPTSEAAAPSEAALPSAAAPAADGTARVFCRASNIWFDSAAALREHCHTDWYRYNLKRSTRGLPPVTEVEFDDLVDTGGLGDDEELSGSDEEEEGEEGGGDGEGVALTDGRVALRDADGGVFLAWRTALVPPATAPSSVPLASLPQCLRALAAMQPRPVWVVVLCRGGHFAAAACELQAQPRGSKRPEDALRVLAHRCFHRYVTRRKAGGRQSVADGAKSIKSAGSSIRRHNEAMLAREIRELLGSWAATHLRVAHLIWVAAPGPANAAVLYSGADAPLLKSDQRLRAIPFNTARPTLAEASRVAARLSRIEFLDASEVAAFVPAASKSEEELAAERAEATAALEAMAAAEAARRAATEQAAATAAAEVAQAEATAAALPSDLHDAAAAGDAAEVARLLEAGHDPTVGHIRHGFRVPYDVAKSKEVRNTFRRYLAAQPDRWDWAQAHVPSALTDEAEAERDEKAKEKAKEKKKKAEKARKERRKAEEGARAEAVRVLRDATAGEAIDALQHALDALLSLGGADEADHAPQGDAAAALAAARQRVTELTDPDWQRRRERERRAEAAERRLGGLSDAQRAFMMGSKKA